MEAVKQTAFLAKRRIDSVNKDRLETIQRNIANRQISWCSSMASVIAPEWQKQKKRRESIIPEFIDFKRYSRFLNPDHTSYEFGLK